MTSGADTAELLRALGRLPRPPRRRVEGWGTLVRVLLLLTLIPAVWLGIITIPPAAATATMALLAGYIALLALGPRYLPLLRRPDLILVLDMLVITLLLLISGNLNSPFLYLYYLVILEAAVRLDLRQALAASIATAALIILLWLNAGYAAALRDTGFYLGAFIAGGFLLALFLGMLVHEQRAREEQLQWATLLDQRLREATRQLGTQLEELQFYNDLAVHLSGELRMEGVMEILLRAYLKAMGFSGGMAYVVGEDAVVRLAAAHGVARPDDADLTPPLTLADASAETGMRVLPHPPGSKLPGTLSVCVPLVRAGHPRAWLCGLSDAPPAVADATRRLLHGITAQGVSALEAARLHEEVQRMIRTDPLRSLFTWAGLEKLVTDEIERCRTLSLAFSLAEIQMEDYGSSAAETPDRDLALRRAVNLIQGALRRVDVLSCDGAARFAILLPRMPKAQAAEMAQALVENLEQDTVAARLLMVERVALTAGVVTFPEDGPTASALFAGVESLLVRGPSTPARVQVPAG